MLTAYKGKQQLEQKYEKNISRYSEQTALLGHADTIFDCFFFHSAI